MKSHELIVVGVLALGAAGALAYYQKHHVIHRPPPRMAHPMPVIPRQKDIHEPHYVANERFPYDNDPWNIGIPTPLKGLPMNIDTWRGTGGHNRIAKEVRNTQMLYGGRGAV